MTAMRARAKSGSRSEAGVQAFRRSGVQVESTSEPERLNARTPECLNADHLPVMLPEVLEALAPRSGGLYLDSTVGLGGHAGAVLERLAPGGRLLGLDQDPQALEIARARLSEVAQRQQWSVPEPFHLEKANFTEAAAVLGRLGESSLRGALFDLGVSSLQLDRPERGFSFLREGPLDMRMDSDQPVTAAQLVNHLPEPEMARIISDYGEERWARRVAREIVRERERRPLVTTADLAAVVARAVPQTPGLTIHPATRTFQALRIAVNRELEVLAGALEACARRLEPGGRLVVLAYHSLEDRIVKRTFARLSGHCQCPPRLPACGCGAAAILRPLARKPLTPGVEELARNPRARSARLRAAERTADNR
jgi:16S rRNA (cytosine1402-N4)-methyltransferase